MAEGENGAKLGKHGENRNKKGARKVGETKAGAGEKLKGKKWMKQQEYLPFPGPPATNP